MRFPYLSAVLFAYSAVAVPAFGAGPVAPPPAATGGTPIVSAFYYPWFATSVVDGSYAHWAQDGHKPPKDIASVYYPALGVYSSDDPKVLGDQMKEIQRAGIDQIAVSWWGWGSIEDQRLPGIIQAAGAL